MQVKAVPFFLLLIIMLLACINPVIGLDKAPDFTLFNINGNEIFSLSDYQGKVVLIDLFRMKPSCPPCIYEIPHLKAVYNKYSRNELIVMSISVSSLDTDDALRSDLVEEYDITWIVACGESQIASKYSVSGVPTLVIVDAEGYVRYRHEGVTGESTLTSEIDHLLSEPSNGDSNGDSGTVPPGPPYELIAIIGGVVVVFLVIGIVVVGQKLEWSKPSKKRRRPKR
jgi:thiol-disulfide isomerase/thioredoxin